MRPPSLAGSSAWLKAVMTALTLAVLSLVVSNGASWVSQRPPQLALQLLSVPQLEGTEMGGAAPDAL